MDGNDGEIQVIRLPGGGVQFFWPETTHTTADHVGGDHKILVGIDGFAGANHFFPPALFLGDGVGADGILVRGQAMANQDHVRFIGIQGAIGLVRHREILDFRPGIEAHRLSFGQMDDLPDLYFPILGTKLHFLQHISRVVTKF